MSKLPEEVKNAWDNREAAIVLTTISESGIANSIYATCVSQFDDETIIVADNYFDKTRKNILSGSNGVILFITKEGKAYQLKGSLEYCKEGSVFDDMKKWNDPKHPGHAAVALKVEEIYKGADKIV